MRKIYIYIILALIIGSISTNEALAWGFGKKVQKLKEQPSQTNEYKFPLDKQASPFNLVEQAKTDDDKQTIKEGNVEQNNVVDEDAGFSQKLELTSDDVDFYTETSQYVAKGNAVLVIPEEKLQLFANQIIIDHRNYEIIGIGNVKILKDGMEHYGDYIRIDTKRESSFFKNPIIASHDITISAKKATMHTNEILAKKGSAIMQQAKNQVLTTEQRGDLLGSKLFDINKTFDSEDDDITVVAKKVHVKRYNDITDVTVEHATFYKGGLKVGYTPNFRMSTDKDTNYYETMLPEMGSHPRVGMFIAPSVLVGLPNAATLKAGPLFSLDKSKFGIGGFARLSTPKSKSTLMYSSAQNNFVFNTDYKFNEDFRLKLAWNDYIDGGWMGGQLPDYAIELEYKKDNTIPQANARVTNYLTAGFYKDNGKDFNGMDLRTMRYKWQMSLYNDKPILNWKKYLMLGYAYEHDFSLYQTGDRMGVLRAGPRLYSDLGRLYLELTYFAGGQYGESPFIFDRYRYGHNNIRFRGQYYLNKYISLGYYASYNINEVDYEGRKLTENQIVASVGTEDIKLRFGYDPIRNSSVFGLDMLLGTNKTYMKFDEMTVTNLEPKENAKKAKAEKKAQMKKRGKKL